jgi:hypothetical protein
MNGPDRQASSLNWFSPHFTLTTGGGAPVFTAKYGFTCNGTSDYMDSGCNPSTYVGMNLALFGAAGSMQFSSMFAMFPSLLATTNLCGSNNGPTSIVIGSNATTQLNRIATTANTNVTVGNGIGFYAGSYCDSTNLTTMYNGAFTATARVPGLSKPNSNFIIGGQSPTSLAHCDTAAAGCGAALNQNQMKMLWNVWNGLWVPGVAGA